MRFWIVQQVPNSKYIVGVNPLFKKDTRLLERGIIL